MNNLAAKPDLNWHKAIYYLNNVNKNTFTEMFYSVEHGGIAHLILTYGRWREEDREFEASLGYVTCSCLKKKNEMHKVFLSQILPNT